ncbi:copper-binding protein [uncultured Brevundimonas sp.]|uniref:copper-binding protein n=1 Tax=uncultured Brevundimonas sp. TaxID=213418 RepID=UPI0030EF2F4E|tara:strand:- start:50452 stop:50835 length:384 start_codon:yes stop_codon:yes gene_type:complete
MNHALILSAAAAATLGLSACGQPETAPAADPAPASEMPMPSNMSGMPMEGRQAAMMGAGSGVITAVDAAAGTVTIDHGAIPAVEWPAMAMTFTAPTEMLATAKVGDRVAFDVSVHDGVNEITALRPQ